MRDRREFLKVACQAAAFPFFGGALSRAATLVRYPYVQNLRSNRATIVWTTLEKVAGEVQFSNDRSFSRSAPARTREFTPDDTGMAFTYYRHHALLAGLAAGAEYSYRVLVEGEDLTPGDTLRFRTRGYTPFSFLAFGDSGAATPEQNQLAQLMSREDPALVLHTGDLVYPHASFDHLQKKYFDFYFELMKRVAFFPSPGNHDYDYTQATPYLTVHELPTEEVPEEDHGRYYSFDWGNVHFVALDSNVPLARAVQGTGRMLEWLDQDLARTRQFWRVVYFHHPPYSTGPNQRDPISAWVRQRVAPILDKHQIPVVLNGHEHSYQRSKPIRGGASVAAGAGTVYVTTGGGGATLYPVPANPLGAIGASAHHYLRVEVAAARLTVRAIRVDGREIDTFTLTPPPVAGADSVVNTASFSPALGAGGLVSVFGRQLCAEENQAARLPLPTQLSGVSLTLNGQRLPLFYVSATQINAQLPFGVIGSATMRLTSANGSVEVPVRISELAPAVFAGGVLRLNGTRVSAAAPAQQGEWISVYLTGMGRLRAEVAIGEAATGSPPPAVQAPVTVEFGGLRFTPSFAGLAPGLPGVYQVNWQAPYLPDGQHPLRIVAGGVPSNVVNVPVAAPES